MIDALVLSVWDECGVYGNEAFVKMLVCFSLGAVKGAHMRQRKAAQIQNPGAL
jgi:hypothetical protein